MNVLTARWEMEHGGHYVKRHVGQLNALRRWLAFVGADRRVSSIGNDDMVMWAHHEAGREISPDGRKMSPVSIRRCIITIRAALRHAQENNDDLASYRIPRTPRSINVDNQRTRILEDGEITAIAAVLSVPPPKWRNRRELAWRDAFDFFRIALATAGGCGEILSIKWVDVNHRFGTVLLVSTKTGGKTRTLHAPAAAEIIRQRREDGLGSETHVFTLNDHSIRDAFRAASKICKIEYGQRDGWSVHDLRRTSLTSLLQQGVDLAAVRDFAGHYSIAQTSRYVHPKMKSRARVAEASSRLVRMASQVGGNSEDSPAGGAQGLIPAHPENIKKVG